MQVTSLVVASVLGALASLGVTAFAWRRRGTPGAVPLAAFTAATAVWTGANAFQAASTALGPKLFWANVQYVGAGVVPLAWFAFACEYADREEWVTPRTLGALAVVPAVTLVLAWTNPSHHLVRETSELVVVDGAVELRRTFGPWFWAANVYLNLVNGAGTVVLLRGLLRSRRLYRLQTLAVLAGTTVPWAGATLYYNDVSAVEPEVFFAVTSVAFGVAISRHGLLDVVPVGRYTVVEEMADPVVVVDGDRVADANPAAADLFGWSDVDAAVGLPAAEAWASHPELGDRYEADDVGGELTVETPDGRERHFDARTTALPDRTAGTRIHHFRDVTARKRHEERLERQNERLERVGRTIGHDLRNPLNVAQGRLELAHEDAGADAADHLGKVADAHGRMGDIIDDVLAMAREEDAGERGRRSLRDAAERAWANVDTAGADLAFDGDPGAIEADEGQLASAFENLFRNAVEHAGPEVTVRVGALDAGFYVADDGPGVPESDREQVFEHGFTTRRGGSGVGLAVVEDVAESHGWRVAVTESESGGARFEFRGAEKGATARR